MTAATAEPSVALVLVVNVQTLREKSFSIEMPHLPPTMENIGGGMAGPSKSAVGPIWLGRRLEQKTAQKTCSAMSFSLFSLNLKYKLLVVMVSINFF